MNANGALSLKPFALCDQIQFMLDGITTAHAPYFLPGTNFIQDSSSSRNCTSHFGLFIACSIVQMVIDNRSILS